MYVVYIVKGRTCETITFPELETYAPQIYALQKEQDRLTVMQITNAHKRAE